MSQNDKYSEQVIKSMDNIIRNNDIILIYIAYTNLNDKDCVKYVTNAGNILKNHHMVIPRISDFMNIKDILDSIINCPTGIHNIITQKGYQNEIMNSFLIALSNEHFDIDNEKHVMEVIELINLMKPYKDDEMITKTLKNMKKNWYLECILNKWTNRC